jgi:hypothetical protein
MDAENARSLVIVWSSADREVALNMVFMYARNAMLKGWWDKVRLIAWGPADMLAARDQEVREAFLEAGGAGVELWACRACADRYGLVAELEGLGVNVLYTGQPLTEMLQSGWTCLTF